MKQLITRIDDDLHRRLKERAVEEDRSLNDLVSSVLAAAVQDDAASLRRRVDRSGLRVLPPQPPVRQSRAAVIERQRGSGRSARLSRPIATSGEPALRRHLGADPLLLPRRA